MVWVTKIPWPVFLVIFSNRWAQGLELDAATGCGWGGMGECSGGIPGGMGYWSCQGYPWLGRPLNLNWFLVPGASSRRVSATPLMLGSDLEGFRFDWHILSHGGWYELNMGTLHFRSCSQFSLKAFSTPVWLYLLSLFQVFAVVIHPFFKSVF